MADQMDNVSSQLPEEKARQHLMNARKLCEEKKFPEAVKECREAIKIYEKINNLMGVSCSLIDMSNVYRTQAFNTYTEKLKGDASAWGGEPFNPTDPVEVEIYIKYVKNFVDIEWYASSSGGVVSKLH